MTSTPQRSVGFRSATLNQPKQLKYWAQLAAIRAIMRDAPDPATVLDALFEEMSPTITATDGKTVRPRMHRQVVKRGRPPKAETV